MTTPYRARALFATAGSDLLTDVNAYEQCMRLRAQGEPAFNNFCEQVSSNVADECISAQTYLRTSYQRAPYNPSGRYGMISSLT